MAGCLISSVQCASTPRTPAVRPEPERRLPGEITLDVGAEQPGPFALHHLDAHPHAVRERRGDHAGQHRARGQARTVDGEVGEPRPPPLELVQLLELFPQVFGRNPEPETASIGHHRSRHRPRVLAGRGGVSGTRWNERAVVGDSGWAGAPRHDAHREVATDAGPGVRRRGVRRQASTSTSSDRASGRGAGTSSTGAESNFRSLELFHTTKVEDRAIDAPAISGSRRPRAARGIAARL